MTIAEDQCSAAAGEDTAHLASSQPAASLHSTPSTTTHNDTQRHITHLANHLDSLI